MTRDQKIDAVCWAIAATLIIGIHVIMYFILT
jgi:hypothetical protein